MKKWFAIVGVIALVVLVGATVAVVALAQGPLDGDGEGVGDGGEFVDENGDGVCDLWDDASRGAMRGGRFSWDGQSEGPGGWQAGGEMPCDDFVDEDGDGVCDDYVDDDGDGVCDRRDESLARPFAGYGGRGGMRRGRIQSGQGRP